MEFFVHSPFASRLDNGTLVDRNQDSIVVQATFSCGTTETKVILGADVGNRNSTPNPSGRTSDDSRMAFEVDGPANG